VLEDLSLLNGAGLFKALFQRDKGLLYSVMLRGVLLSFVESCTNAYTKYFQNKLQVLIGCTINRLTIYRLYY
jgi:hypothetical protein